ncbi:hypothetical protein [Mycobacterium intracellulare]|nr:hypothetical protein [Mycobacterium intracellulare]
MTEEDRAEVEDIVACVLEREIPGVAWPASFAVAAAVVGALGESGWLP